MKKEITIPESINDIALCRWQRYMSIVKEDSTDDFANRKALEVFYDIKGEYFNKLRVKDIDFMISELNKALNQKIPLIRQFELNGILYGFVPNLDDISFGEFVDMDTNSGIEDLHKLMSILYRPITKKKGDKYIIQSYKGINEDLSGMLLGVAQSAYAFFFDIGLQLTSDTLKSLTPQGEDQTRKLDLVRNGVGILQSIPFQMGMFLNSTKLQK
jgi:hypothetical protein